MIKHIKMSFSFSMTCILELRDRSSLISAHSPLTYPNLIKTKCFVRKEKLSSRTQSFDVKFSYPIVYAKSWNFGLYFYFPPRKHLPRFMLSFYEICEHQYLVSPLVWLHLCELPPNDGRIKYFQNITLIVNYNVHSP